MGRSEAGPPAEPLSKALPDFFATECMEYGRAPEGIRAAAWFSRTV
jgi:hypothetical protein